MSNKQPEKIYSAEEVAAAVLRIKTAANLDRYPQGYKLALNCIDLTTLNSTDQQVQGSDMAQKVSAFVNHYPGLENVAAICVYPTLIGVVKEHLTDSSVQLAAVAAGFPSSQTFLTIKEAEVRMSVEAGANEIDIVLNLGHFLAGDDEAVVREVSTLKKGCGKAHLKVILETGALKTPELIAKASRLAIAGGADFIKTSTGKMSPAATPEAAWVMCQVIREHYEKTGKKIGFKAAGGIVESDEALYYLAIVDDVLGNEWLNNKLFRIGASRLANNLLTSINGHTTTYF